MINPLPYRKQKSDPVMWFVADVTPDGWKNSRNSGRISGIMEPDELMDMTKIIRDMIKLCPDNQELAKYFRKHGKKTRCEGMDPTMAFMVQSQMTYILEETGPNFRIEAYRTDS